MATSKKTDEKSKDKEQGKGKSKGGAESPMGGSKGGSGQTTESGGRHGKPSEERGSGKNAPRSS